MCFGDVFGDELDTFPGVANFTIDSSVVPVVAATRRVPATPREPGPYRIWKGGFKLCCDGPPDHYTTSLTTVIRGSCKFIILDHHKQVLDSAQTFYHKMHSEKSKLYTINNYL